MRLTPEQLAIEAGAQEAFFAAMKAGYAVGGEKVHIPQLPRSKVIPFEHGDYSVYDCYFTAEESTRSSGMTIIWLKGQPVWTMQYQGWYELEAIPFLKRALKSNYERDVFLGGRGPKMFRQLPFTYYNYVEEFREDFRHFVGRETISLAGPEGGSSFVGWHEYQGMLYLPNGD